jgi:hypothetical protein
VRIIHISTTVPRPRSLAAYLDTNSVCEDLKERLRAGRGLGGAHIHERGAETGDECREVVDRVKLQISIVVNAVVNELKHIWKPLSCPIALRALLAPSLRKASDDRFYRNQSRNVRFTEGSSYFHREPTATADLPCKCGDCGAWKVSKESDRVWCSPSRSLCLSGPF